MRKLLALTALLAASCSSSGTYVLVTVAASASAPQGIVAVELDLSLGGRSATETLTEKTGGPIQFPTNASLTIVNGSGLLTITAKALDDQGRTLVTAIGTGTVVRGQTITVPIQLGEATTLDGGVDLLPLGGDLATGTVVLDADSAMFDFGSAVTGGQSQAKMFTITNAGTATSAMLTSAIVPGGSFGLMSDQCTGKTLAPNATCTVGAVFSPSATGSSTAALTMSASGATSANVALSGLGVAPGSLTPSVPQLTFGSVVQGTASGEMTVMIQNSGGAPSGTLSASLGGNDMNEFTISSDTCSTMTLGPTATCTIGIELTPLVSGASGSESASLTVSATPGGSALVQLGGTALTPGMVTITPSSNDFMVVDVGAPAAKQTFTVTNTGGGPAPITSVATTPATDFSVVAGSDTCTGAMLAGSGGACTVDVQFVPSSFGAKSASLDVTGTPFGTASAPLTGTGRDTVALTVVPNGTGGGSVAAPATGDVANTPINCGTTCTDSFYRGATLPMVTLTATPDSISDFGGWSGGSCTGTGTCTVTLSAATTVTATFTVKTMTITVATAGVNGQTGGIGSNDGQLNCGTACGPVTYNESMAGTITLTATPAAGNTFIGWSGTGCKGTAKTCVVPLLGNVNVTATFGPQQYMFVTSTTYPIGSGGAAGADAACAARATAAGLPGTYKAWVSTSTGNANLRVGTGGWVRVDGRPFAANLTALTTAPNYAMYYPPRIDELGNDLGASLTQVATGGDVAGRYFNSGIASLNCTDFSSTVTLFNSMYVGDAAAGPQVWTSTPTGVGSCAGMYRFYCMRSDTSATITVPNQPGRHVFLSTNAFVASNGLAAADTECRTEASAAGLANASTFVAFMATDSASAASRVNLTGLPWKRLDNVFVVTHPGDLTVSGGQLIAPPVVSADASLYTGVVQDTWSGAADPTLAGTDASTCKNWTSASASDTGKAGQQNGTLGSSWFLGVNTPCSNSVNVKYLLCFEP